MVALCLSFRGERTLHFAPNGERANSDHYLKMAKDVYEPDCHERCGIPTECWFQKDGASAHTSNMVQSYCVEKLPNFWGKKSWPACSPDLNAPDYFRWGYLQREVEKRNPSCLDSLKLAIRRGVDAAPLEMAHRAISASPKRVKMCIAANGGPFKHQRLGHGLMTYPAATGHDGEEPGGI